MKSMVTAAVVVALAAAAVHDFRPCIPVKKKYGLVCICNETYCDNVPPLPTSIGTLSAVVYTSSKAGLRMQQVIVSINDTTVGHSRKIHIDPSTTFQTLLGFGNALTDAALLNFNKMTFKVQAELLEQYWGASGTQYQVGRIPISSTDFSTHVYSYDDNPGDTSLSKFSIDFDRKMGKIDFIDKVLSKANATGRQMTLFASSWAPPIWMTTQNSTVQNPTLKDGPTGGTAHVYAQYLVQFFEEYAKEGIKFWGLTAQNEPSGNTGKWQGLTFTPSQQRDFIKTCLGPALKASVATRNLKLMMLDDQRAYLPDWVKTVLSDPDAAKYISGIGLHWYRAVEDDLPSALYFGYMNETHHAYPGFFMLATEACEGYLPWSSGPRLGDWERGEKYAHDITGDLNNYAVGWTDWNAFLDLKGGPNWADNECDSPILLDVDDTKTFYKQPMYYALAHFSSFLPKGSVRVGLVSQSNSIFDAPMECVGFRTPGGKLVLVVLNRIAFSASYSISTPKGWIDLTSPPHSFQTIIIEA